MNKEETKFCKYIQNVPRVLINTKSEALQHVKNHKNVFANRIIRRSRIYEDFIIVTETSYYDEVKKYWLWIFHKDKGLFIIEEPFYKIEKIIKILTEHNFDINKLKTINNQIIFN